MFFTCAMKAGQSEELAPPGSDVHPPGDGVDPPRQRCLAAHGRGAGRGADRRIASDRPQCAAPRRRSSRNGDHGREHLRKEDRAAAAQVDWVPTAAKTFWMTSDDKALGSRPAEAATANGIAGEWRSAESTRTVPGSAVLGPMRLGSLWLMAVRFPIAGRKPVEVPGSRAWSVAYADLDELIAASHLARLTGMGYDFELSQVEPSSGRLRSFVSSRTEGLTDAVAARIRLP